MLLDRAQIRNLRVSTAVRVLLRGDTVAARLWYCVCEAAHALRERQFCPLPDPLAVVPYGQADRKRRREITS
jgi:hypothetical protein